MAIENAGGIFDAETADQPKADVEGDRSVDWQALWEEFGFDSPDAAGNEYATPTQLRAALEASEQSCPSGQGVIDDAVNDGTLTPIHRAADPELGVDDVLSGYALTLEVDDE